MIRWSLRSLADHLILQFVLYSCQNFMFLRSLVDEYGVGGNDTVLNNQNGFCPHLCANPQRRRKYKRLNMKMVTLRKTLKQTAESFISWPACHEKGRACQILQAIKAGTLASSYFELPSIPHTQTTQENCLSSFIFVPFGYTSIYAKSSPKPLSCSCHCILSVVFRGFEKQLQSSGEAQGWWPWR